MWQLRIAFAASLLLGSSACVAQDGGYGSGYGSGYGGGYDSGYSSGYGSDYGSYGYPTQGYPVPAYPAQVPGYVYGGQSQIRCQLPGRDTVTTPGECRDLQRRFGVTENDSRRRSGQVLCRLPGDDRWVSSQGECHQLQRRAGGRTEQEAERRSSRGGRDDHHVRGGRDNDHAGGGRQRCNLPGQDAFVTADECRRLQRSASSRSDGDRGDGRRGGGFRGRGDNIDRANRERVISE